jgi:hypothetical protein
MEAGKTPKQRQREDEEEHEQEQEHMNGHKDPRCLKWGEWIAPYIFKGRIRRVYNAVKRLGEKSELSTTVKRCTALIN